MISGLTSGVATATLTAPEHCSEQLDVALEVRPRSQTCDLSNSSMRGGNNPYPQSAQSDQCNGPRGGAGSCSPEPEPRASSEPSRSPTPGVAACGQYKEEVQVAVTQKKEDSSSSPSSHASDHENCNCADKDSEEDALHIGPSDEENGSASECEGDADGKVEQ